jgi:hypothetical protein
MIRINLVDNTTPVKHVDFLVVPVTNDKGFTCVPEGVLPLGAVVRLSRKVKARHVLGEMGKYLWYRVIEKASGTHMNAFAGYS